MLYIVVFGIISGAFHLEMYFYTLSLSPTLLALLLLFSIFLHSFSTNLVIKFCKQKYENKDISDYILTAYYFSAVISFMVYGGFVVSHGTSIQSYFTKFVGLLLTIVLMIQLGIAISNLWFKK